MKKFLAGLLIGLLLATAAPAVAGIYGQFQGYDIVKVIINNKEVQGDTPTIIMEGRTMVPLRVVSEQLGAKVEWDSINQQAKIDGKVIQPVDKAEVQEIIQDVAKRYKKRAEVTTTTNTGALSDEKLDENMKESTKDSAAVIRSLANVAFSQQQDLVKEGAHLTLLNQALASEQGFLSFYHTALQAKDFEKLKAQAAPMAYWKTMIETQIK